MLSDKELRDMMRDPRYWSDHDPEYVERVTAGFRERYGTKTPKPQVESPINYTCEASKALDDILPTLLNHSSGWSKEGSDKMQEIIITIRKFIQSHTDAKVEVDA